MTAHVTKKILTRAGIDSERLALNWASAAEAPLYVELITGFTRRIKDLGPLGSIEGLARDEIKSKLSVALAAVENVKLRVQIAKLAQGMRKLNDYSPESVEAEISKKVNDTILKVMDKQGASFDRVCK